MSGAFDEALAMVDENIDRCTSRVGLLLDDYETCLDRLARHSEPQVPHDMSVVVRTLEAVLAEALQIGVLFSHKTSNPKRAHLLLEHIRRAQVVTLRALDSK